MSDLVTKLVPILYVEDPESERRFYATFDLRTTYEGPEYPGFIAVGNDSVEFGLTTRADSDPSRAKSVLQWQLGVSDVDAVIAACERDGPRLRRVGRAAGARLALPHREGAFAQRVRGVVRGRA